MYMKACGKNLTVLFSLIVQKLLGISNKLSIKLISIQFAETSVRKVTFICTVKKVETMYAQNMVISYLHCNTVHFVGELVALYLKNQSVREAGLKIIFRWWPVTLTY